MKLRYEFANLMVGNINCTYQSNFAVQYYVINKLIMGKLRPTSTQVSNTVLQLHSFHFISVKIKTNCILFKVKE